MEKIVITGSNGLLGQYLLDVLLKEPEKYEVYGFSRGINRTERTDFNYVTIDITEKEILEEKLENINPTVIINTAAVTNVDACETRKEACNLLNVNVVEWLTIYASKNKTHIIHISTDFIFDGKKGNYTESDAPNPLSFYGMSKLKSEEILLKSKVSFTILRTILVYGKVNGMSRGNIVLWVKSMLEKGKEVTIVDDQFRMPTYAANLAMACKIAIDKKIAGIFNISSNTLLSIYEIALQIAEIFDLNEKLIKPINTSTLNQTAQRPLKTGFDLSKTNEVFNFYPKSFKEDLLLFKETLFKK